MGVGSVDHGLRPEAVAEVARVRGARTLAGSALPQRIVGPSAGCGSRGPSPDGSLCRPGPDARRGARLRRHRHGPHRRRPGRDAPDAPRAWVGARGERPASGRTRRAFSARCSVSGEPTPRPSSPRRVSCQREIRPTPIHSSSAPGIRHHVLPALREAAGPSVVERLARFAARGGGGRGAARRAASAHALERVRDGAGLDAVAVRALPWPHPRTGRSVPGSRGSATRSRTRLLREVAAALQRGGHTGLPGRAELATEGGWVRVLPRAPATTPA